MVLKRNVDGVIISGHWMSVHCGSECISEDKCDQFRLRIDFCDPIQSFEYTRRASSEERENRFEYVAKVSIDFNELLPCDRVLSGRLFFNQKERVFGEDEY